MDESTGEASPLNMNVRYRLDPRCYMIPLEPWNQGITFIRKTPVTHACGDAGSFHLCFAYIQLDLLPYADHAERIWHMYPI